MTSLSECQSDKKSFIVRAIKGHWERRAAPPPYCGKRSRLHQLQIRVKKLTNKHVRLWVCFTICIFVVLQPSGTTLTNASNSSSSRAVPWRRSLRQRRQRRPRLRANPKRTKTTKTMIILMHPPEAQEEEKTAMRHLVQMNNRETAAIIKIFLQPPHP